MKKIFYACVAALAMFAFVACGNNKAEEEVVEAEAIETVDSTAVAIDSVAVADTTVVAE